jgi:hypothetical protein
VRRRPTAIALAIGMVLVLSGIGVESAAAFTAFTRSRLVVSLSPDRAQPVQLHRARLDGKVYVFVRDSGNLRRVEFYVDDPRRRKPPLRVETRRPFDFAGTASTGRAIGFDTTRLTDGRHRITALLRWSNGRTSIRRGVFVVDNQAARPGPKATAAPSTRPTTQPSTTRGPEPSTTPITEPPRTPTTAPTAEPSPTPTAQPSTTTSAPTPGPTITTPPASTGSWPSAPPARVCGNAAVLNGPARPPAGAVVVPAGDNSSLNLNRPEVTYWFAPGVHTLGSGEYSQIRPGDNSTYVGAPGAVIDGQRKNKYAFTQHGRGVTIKHLTIRNFVAPMNEGTVNHDSGVRWIMQFNTVVDNGGAGIFLGTGNRASYNCLKNNSQYGFQAYGARGVSDIVLDHNEITGNNTGTGRAGSPAVAAPVAASSGTRAMSGSPTTTSTTTPASGCGPTRTTTTSCSKVIGSRTTAVRRSSGRSATTRPSATT